MLSLIANILGIVSVLGAVLLIVWRLYKWWTLSRPLRWLAGKVKRFRKGTSSHSERVSSVFQDDQDQPGVSLRGAKAVLYVVLYLTFLASAYVLAYYWVVAMFGAPAARTLDPWEARFLLLPVCLLAPYVLVRVFAGSRWLARLAVLALVLGLVPIFGPPLSAELCREQLLDLWGWLGDFCGVSVVGWASGVSAVSAVLHLLVLGLGVKCVMAVSGGAEQAARAQQPAGGQDGGERAGGKRSRLRKAIRRGAGWLQERFRAVRKSIGKRDSAGASGEKGSGQGRSTDGSGPGLDVGSTSVTAAAASIWRRGAAWVRQKARRGAAGAASGANAVRREARWRAAAVAQTAKQRIAAGWSRIRGAGDKLRQIQWRKPVAGGWRGLKNAGKKERHGDGADEGGA